MGSVEIVLMVFFGEGLAAPKPLATRSIEDGTPLFEFIDSALQSYRAPWGPGAAPPA
ncbi:hypothetical protein J2129_002119 [Methanofollis sp. W23]|uniref:hypothetical protein n=1 Tax=Methanofollis sp. W23 TaxID=2817849 RepID=UPI001AE80FC9|nr:hypothetical protein [Methanofollis sp. W23]MBP2146665.1 hypothetical protein [Methanofollis sp. W23]